MSAAADRKLVIPRSQSYELAIVTPGILDDLILQSAARDFPGPGEVEIQVSTMGLNFREVMKALGIYPNLSETSLTFGGDCAGRIAALGDGVEEFRVGDEVIAISPYRFGTFVTVSADLVVPKLRRHSFNAAATIPTAFLTAYYALCHVARLQPDERVLIHAAAGAVGLAAAQIAKSVGAEVFATAGRPEKQEFLRSLGIQHVMSSRSPAFTDEVNERTAGRGVDVVLNSLAGKYLSKSLSTLGTFGRFLEIGKIDMHGNQQLRLEPFLNCLSFHAIDLERVWRERPSLFVSLFHTVMTYFTEGILTPLPHKTFPIAEVVSAFRYMRKAKHIGKIVVSLEG